MSSASSCRQVRASMAVLQGARVAALLPVMWRWKISKTPPPPPPPPPPPSPPDEDLYTSRAPLSPTERPRPSSSIKPDT